MLVSLNRDACPLGVGFCHLGKFNRLRHGKRLFVCQPITRLVRQIINDPDQPIIGVDKLNVQRFIDQHQIALPDSNISATGNTQPRVVIDLSLLIRKLLDFPIFWHSINLAAFSSSITRLTVVDVLSILTANSSIVAVESLLISHKTCT
jgi:hypothetical protein